MSLNFMETKTLAKRYVIVDNSLISLNYHQLQYMWSNENNFH